MTFKIVNTIHIPGIDFGTDLLKNLDTELYDSPSRTEDELMESVSGADAIICSIPVQEWTARVVQSLNNCRVIASIGIGFDRIDMDEANEKRIAVTNTPDYCIDEVSTHTIALVLALARQLLKTNRTVRKQSINFVPPNRKGIDNILNPLYRTRNQTLGIVGMGRIGTATALKAKALGMRVIAHDPYVFRAVMNSHGVEKVAFHELLKSADFVCINAALTHETQNMFNRKAFKMMKANCYLINTARGEIVDEDSLIEAIEKGELAGAGLDVSREDPLSPKNPLLALKNVILTGHSAWYSVESDSNQELWHKAMAQVVEALDNHWPEYAVNPEIRERWIKKWVL